MLKKLIQAYHKANNVSRLKVIEKIMSDENFFREEITCFDDGRVEAGVIKLQKDYNDVCTEMKFLKDAAANAPDTKDKLNYLYQRQYEMLKAYAFEASQNLNNIDNCLEIMQGLKDDFCLCLQGLKAYAENDRADAFGKLTEYLKLKKTFGRHYLINKIYGLMLFEQGMSDEAGIFLQRVTQICPEDVEVHEKMKEIYHKQGNERGEKIESDILKVLGAV